MAQRVAYIIGFAAPPVLRLHELVDLMKCRDWECYVILSPTAATWVDLSRLASVSGNSVRVQPRVPSDPEFLPLVDAIIAAPITFNSLNKWALGISDNLALGILNEALGVQVPKTAVVSAKYALRQHPVFARNLDAIHAAGVTIIDSNDESQCSGNHFEWVASQHE